DQAPAEYRAHAVTGLTRTAALLKEGRVGLLAGSPTDLAALVARSALKLDTLETVVIAWPESLAGELDPLLAEAVNARRIVLSWNPPALADFLERHARRAEVVGNLPLDPDGKPLGPVGSARFAVVSATRRRAGLRDALDVLRATKPYVWTGGEIAAPTPLFEEHDPALVAAALLASTRQPSAVSIQSRDAEIGTGGNEGAWMKIFVTVGTKDRASAKDLVGALIKEAGLQKGQIGKIEVRESFSLVEIAPPSVDQAVRRLSGVAIRGRRVTARPGRG